jgi:hypothetical protein
MDADAYLSGDIEGLSTEPLPSGPGRVVQAIVARPKK